MLQFIKKLFGFGKNEVKSDVFVTTETPANSITIPVGSTKEEAEKALVDVIASHKEEITINKTKEELEKIVSERLLEIENEKAPVVEKKAEPKKPAPKKAPVVEKKAEPKKPATPAKKTKGVKPVEVEKKTEPKKPAPKKDTKKGKK